MDFQRERGFCPGSSLELEHLAGVPQGGAEAEGPAPAAGNPDAEGLFEVKAQLSRAKPWETACPCRLQSEPGRKSAGTEKRCKLEMKNPGQW